MKDFFQDMDFITHISKVMVTRRYLQIMHIWVCNNRSQFQLQFMGMRRLIVIMFDPVP